MIEPVPANIRLDRLRLTLQAAMGWTNSHLYPFEAGQATWGLPDPDFGSEDLPANKHTLWDVIEDTGRKTIHYIHDFGDDWEHKIKIGKFSDPVPGELHPRLIKVTGRCPPEDIGGFNSSPPWPIPSIRIMNISRTGSAKTSIRTSRKPTT